MRWSLSLSLCLCFCACACACTCACVFVLVLVLGSLFVSQTFFLFQSIWPTPRLEQCGGEGECCRYVIRFSRLSPVCLSIEQYIYTVHTSSCGMCVPGNSTVVRRGSRVEYTYVSYTFYVATEVDVDIS